MLPIRTIVDARTGLLRLNRQEQVADRKGAKRDPLRAHNGQDKLAPLPTEVQCRVHLPRAGMEVVGRGLPVQGGAPLQHVDGLDAALLGLDVVDGVELVGKLVVQIDAQQR